MLGAAIGAREECVFPCQSDRPDGAFEDVGIQLDPAIIEKQGEAIPAIEGISDRLGELVLGREAPVLLLQPWLEVIDDGATFAIADDLAVLGREAADLFLYAIEKKIRSIASLAIGEPVDLWNS